MFGLFGDKVVRQGGDGHNTRADGQAVHLALYKYDACPFCQRVFRAIDRLGVHVEYRDVQTDYAHRQGLREQTGRTTVPCLVVDGVPMFESADIVAWLEAEFGSAA